MKIQLSGKLKAGIAQNRLHASRLKCWSYERRTKDWPGSNSFLQVFVA
jgi:hypothetical protein